MRGIRTVWKWTIVCVVATHLMAVFPMTSQGSQAAQDEALRRSEDRRRAIAQRMEQSTVLILVTKNGDLEGVGTGFVVADGHVMTNAHVVNAGSEWYILRDGLNPTQAKLIKRAYDKEPGKADFALLRFSPSSPVPALTFNTQVGRMDRVSAWGFPFMITKFDQSMDKITSGNWDEAPAVVYTEGVVSTVVRSGKARNIIHTAAIAGGNSGGPLINSWGEVVGINTWGTTEEDEGAFVNAALPADKIVDFLQSCGVQPLLSQRTSGLAALSPTQAAGSAVATEGTGGTGAGKSTPEGLAGLYSKARGQQAGETTGQSSGQSTSQNRPPATSGQAQDNKPPAELSGDAAALWELAVQGDAVAQMAVGYAYYEGKDAPKDMQAAVNWLQKAVAQGDTEAEFLLGVIRVTVEGMQDINEGMALLRRAADKDPGYAYLPAILLFEGEYMGIERDDDECAVYAAKGVAAGDDDAMAVLGFLYYWGYGVDEDRQKALELARQGEAKDNARALALLGWMYYMGDPLTENATRSISYATDAAESGDAHGMGLLALMYYHGIDVEQDLERAEAWAVRAAELANEYGQFVLGMIYAKSQDAQKKSAAWAYLDLAANKDVGEADTERDKLAATMSKQQLDEARKLQDNWRKGWGLPSLS